MCHQTITATFILLYIARLLSFISINQKCISRHQLPARHVAIINKLQGSLLYQEVTKCNTALIKAQFILSCIICYYYRISKNSSYQRVHDLEVVDCYTGSDNGGVIFLSEAAVINLTDTMQYKIRRLAQVSESMHLHY